MEIIDLTETIGDNVFCDICNGDYTRSDASGGFLFGSYAYCPQCAIDRLPDIQKYNEEHLIGAHCPKDQSFADWVRNTLR